MPATPNSSAAKFLAARDQLFELRTDYARAYAEFSWPSLEKFNWALDYFDVMAHGNHGPALWVVDEDGSESVHSFDNLSRRSNQVANYLRSLGVKRGDRILLMLGNEVPLWEIMLASMKLGAVITPASTLLAEEDLRDRFERGGIRHVVAGPANALKFAPIEGNYTRICVGSGASGWSPYDESRAAV